MSPIIHLVTGLILVTAHALFLFRGLAMKRKGIGPTLFDKILRFISHFGLPAALFTGFLTEKAAADHHPFHIVLAVLPIITIIAFTPFLKFKRQIPWLLPGLNLVFLAAASLSGAFGI
jgi:hypothetical protein